jgi:23S rRNA pseudouridine2605 synthase
MVAHRAERGPLSGGGQDGERVAKALARAGVASRREVERLIAEGKVALNGEVLTSPAVKVRPDDQVTVDGRPVVTAEPARLFRYHKPAGLMTTHKDPKGRPTVFAALPAGLPRLISVGRLDLSSEGLLLLTNDGALARALELPSSGFKRRYRARAFGRVDQADLDRLAKGIEVAGVRYGPIEARLDKVRDGARGANVWISLTLGEGKNREVRRVLEALGLRVNRLIRVAYGPFALGELAAGQVEEVGPRVVREQLGKVIAPASLPVGDRASWRAPAPVVAAASSRHRLKPPPESAKRKVHKAGWAKAKPRRRPGSPRTHRSAPTTKA